MLRPQTQQYQTGSVQNEENISLSSKSKARFSQIQSKNSGGLTNDECVADDEPYSNQKQLVASTQVRLRRSPSVNKSVSNLKQFETVSEYRMQPQSRVLLDNKVINEFELILNELTYKEDMTLSIKDVAIALFLMKVFVAYPKNYGGLTFEDPLLELHLKNKERSLML